MGARRLFRSLRGPAGRCCRRWWSAHPERYAPTYCSWHENTRDWCIGCQLWWGHQIPVWGRLVSRAEASPEVQAALGGVDLDVAAPGASGGRGLRSAWAATSPTRCGTPPASSCAASPPRLPHPNSPRRIRVLSTLARKLPSTRPRGGLPTGGSWPGSVRPSGRWSHCCGRVPAGRRPRSGRHHHHHQLRAGRPARPREER
ncbi:MAG: class I tRNA ligase family protein [Actinomycetia bacterium]|nr:class I tRNA ligase family protein [Actinomycetes bacterium]